MKNVKRIIVMLLVAVLMTTAVSLPVNAANAVEEKIVQIAKKYPTGSYFSLDGKACTHGQYDTCNNCRLSSISPEAAKTCINGYTCLAFARYVFWYIFGVSPDAQSYQWATIDTINSVAKPGDFITYYKSESYYHAAIYLGSSSNGFYAYTSNYGQANKVKYMREGTKSEYPVGTYKFKVFHASNYDIVANGDSSSTEDTTHTHNYSTAEYEAAHPHKYYKKCSCGDYYYTGATARIAQCESCDFVVIQNTTDRNTITETNAILWGRADKPMSYAVTKIGIRVRKDGENYENGWEKFETPSSDHTKVYYVEPYYNMNTELNVTLTHATTYYYKIYAQINGVGYWSDETKFTTLGSHSYGEWVTTTAATCTITGTKTRSCSCGKTETQTISATGHNYTDNYDESCNLCGKIREIYKSGDTNDDGKINNRDLSLLMQYVNGWDVEILVAAADVNGDGAINNRDLALLMQYVNGWDVEIG